jgi:hypothetical protein
MIGDYFLVSKGKIPMLPYVTFKKLRIASLKYILWVFYRIGLI